MALAGRGVWLPEANEAATGQDIRAALNNVMLQVTKIFKTYINSMDHF